MALQGLFEETTVPLLKLIAPALKFAVIRRVHVPGISVFVTIDIFGTLSEGCTS